MDDHVSDHDGQVRFVLFVEGQSLRSKRARDIINRPVEACGLDLRLNRLFEVCGLDPR